MRLVVLFAFIAVPFCAGTNHLSEVPFNFKGMDDGYSVSSPIQIPLNFEGDVVVEFPKMRKTHAYVCVHSLVPVVAPSRENLTSEFPIDKIWDSTCTAFFNVSSNDVSKKSLNLPSGKYFVIAALPYEYVNSSTGTVITSDYDFDVQFTWKECEGDFFGNDCKYRFKEIQLGQSNFTLEVGRPSFFKLSTMSDRSDVFASKLHFDIQCEGKCSSSSPRLMGFPDVHNISSIENPPFTFTDVHNISSIENPPFTFTDGYYWFISVSATVEEVVTGNITASMEYCKSGTIGANCEEFETLNSTTPGVVARYNHSTTLVFDSSVSVAISGFTGHKKDTVGPDVNVQIDAAPFSDSTKNILLSKGAVANVVDIDFGHHSKIVLAIKIYNNESFGIFVTNSSTHCPEGCSHHGVCSAAEYNCMCSSRYEDIDCSHSKSMSLEYIVLIAVVSALILAIVIGVPIYCYLNRSQEYDVVA